MGMRWAHGVLERENTCVVMEERKKVRRVEKVCIYTRNRRACETTMKAMNSGIAVHDRYFKKGSMIGHMSTMITLQCSSWHDLIKAFLLCQNCVMSRTGASLLHFVQSGSLIATHDGERVGCATARSSQQDGSCFSRLRIYIPASLP